MIRPLLVPVARNLLLGMILLTIAGFSAQAQSPGSINDAWAAYDAQKYEDALKIAKPLAEGGNADAQAILGLLYEFGYGVAVNKEVAAQWYKKGADGGNTTAALGYGYLNYVGEGVPQDYNTAFIYLLLASSDQGEAAYYIGQMYEDGKGVDQSKDNAIVWYQIANNLGYTTAADELSRLGVPQVDSDGGGVAEPGQDEGDAAVNQAFLPCQSMIGEWTWFSGGKAVFGDDGTMTYTSPNGIFSLTRSWECTDGDGEKTAEARIRWSESSGELFTFDQGYSQEIAMTDDSNALYEGSATIIKNRVPLATRQ